MNAPLFSVVVLTWNGRALLEECLESVLAQTGADFELLLVDNGSADGTAEWVRERWGDRLRLVALPENRGFAGGNNAGIRAARGRWLVLLNNDTAVAPGWLAALAAALGRHPAAGMFTPKILNYWRRDEIDNTGHLLYPDGLARGRHRLERDDGRFDREGETLWPSGCAGVYKRELLDDVGLLDESFFAYAEDVDLGLRARWAGWECWYVPTAVVYHKYSATAGAYSPRKAFLVERNRLWVVLKNFPLRELALAWVWSAWRYALHARAALAGMGAAGRSAERFSVAALVGAVLRANLAGLVGAPRVLRQRRAVPRRVSPAALRGLLARFRLGSAEAAFKE